MFCMWYQGGLTEPDVILKSGECNNPLDILPIEERKLVKYVRLIDTDNLIKDIDYGSYYRFIRYYSDDSRTETD